MAGLCVDDFEDLSGWAPIVSGQAELGIAQESGPWGKTLRLDFDFKQGKGFVVATKKTALQFPQRYALKFNLRGISPTNRLEFKLLDESGHNVWWCRSDDLDFSGDWAPVTIDSRQIEFAWGPAGGGVITRVGAIEIAVTAIEGKNGRLWFDSLWLEDKSYLASPLVRASSSQPGHEPAAVFDGNFKTGWRGAAAGRQWLWIDFGEKRECAGFAIHWEPQCESGSFALLTSADAENWTAVSSAETAGCGRSYIYLPDFFSRHIKFDILPLEDSRRIGITEIEIIERESSESIDAFYRAIVHGETRGLYPKYLCGEQTYWTIFGSRAGDCQGLINEEGMVEAHDGAFVIEPFIFTGGKLITWADVVTSQSLEHGYLPIPTCHWLRENIALTVTVFACGRRHGEIVYLRYRLANLADKPLEARLFTAVRPFQVTPPWQSFKQYGGSSRIGELVYRDGIVRIGRDAALVPLTPPAGFGAARFEQGSIGGYLQSGVLPAQTATADAFDAASGALVFDLEVAPRAFRDVILALPAEIGGSAEIATENETAVDARFDTALREWRDALDGAEFDLPAAAREAGETFKSSAAYILLNRMGPALQPGPRRYRRSWIRDGAGMAAALLRVGCKVEAEDFVRWYAGNQAEDGYIPCCVDGSGPDPLPEFDSQGQFVFGVMECFRFSRDESFLTEHWPAVAKAVHYLESLRRQRLTAEYREPEMQVFYGLLPESVSHEGYLSHPVHSYWDDFWALRGIKDALQMAEILGREDDRVRLAALRDDFRACLYASMEKVMHARHIDYLPASVELADCDPAATAVAITLGGELPHLPRNAIAATMDAFFKRFHERRDGGIDWQNYSPYEIRIIGALVRLGDRARAVELLEYYLADRRPPAWNHWAEIVWRDPESPGHIGDMPHTWISAEYMLAFRDLLAYERESDAALVIAAGLPFDWLDTTTGVAVRNLPTWYGRLTFEIRADAATGFEITLHGDLTLPPGGLILQPPCPKPLQEVVINGRSRAPSDTFEARLDEFPAEVRMRW